MRAGWLKGTTPPIPRPREGSEASLPKSNLTRPRHSRPPSGIHPRAGPLVLRLSKYERGCPRNTNPASLLSPSLCHSRAPIRSKMRLGRESIPRGDPAPPGQAASPTLAESIEESSEGKPRTTHPSRREGTLIMSVVEGSSEGRPRTTHPSRQPGANHLPIACHPEATQGINGNRLHTILFFAFDTRHSRPLSGSRCVSGINPSPHPQ